MEGACAMLNYPKNYRKSTASKDPRAGGGPDDGNPQCT